jgi:hypothetical protein
MERDTLTLDLGATTAVELADLREAFRKADEGY